MNTTVLGSVLAWWTSDVPVLPSPQAMQWALQASWSVVLAWLGATLVARWSRTRAVPLGVAAVLAASAWLPGQAATSYWLGLAFQAPSISAVLLCGLVLRAPWMGSRTEKAAGVGVPAGGPAGVVAVFGVVLGWALLLDTFALLPVPLYAWGFSPAAPVVVALLGLAPWLLRGSTRTGGWAGAVGGAAVLLFVLLRLPRGNLWDAVLDPWLWLALHIHVGLKLHACYKNSSCLRTLHKR